MRTVPSPPGSPGPASGPARHAPADSVGSVLAQPVLLLFSWPLDLRCRVPVCDLLSGFCFLGPRSPILLLSSFRFLPHPLSSCFPASCLSAPAAETLARVLATQPRQPRFGPGRRSSVSRAHQAPFCARGLQKIIAVSENAPGAHGIVPRHCSTRAAGMNTVSAARPPPRNLHSRLSRRAAHTAQSPPQRESGKFSRLRNRLRETPAARPTPAEQPLPRREEQQGQTGEQHREVRSLVLDVIFLEEQRSEDESDHDAAAPYHRDDREQRPLILDRIEIECV